MASLLKVSQPTAAVTTAVVELRWDVHSAPADTDQEGRLDVSADNTDGVRSEYAILVPSRSGEGSGSSLGNRLKLTKDMAPELFSYLRMD